MKAEDGRAGHFDERHYTPGELATAWGVAPNTVRRLFQDEQGVLRFGRPSSIRVGRLLKRSLMQMRIPESVAAKVYARLTRKPS